MATVVREVHDKPTLGEKALMLASVAALIFAGATLLFVLWLMLSSVKATAFDSDGVRCYRAASELSCIKTAEPPR